MVKFWLFTFILGASCTFAQTPSKPLPLLEIGYLQSADSPRYQAFLNDSVNQIKEALEGRYQVRLVSFSAKDLKIALDHKKVHYFFANSLFYLSVSASSGPRSSARLAVLWHPKATHPISLGSSVIVKKGSEMTSISALQDKEVAVRSREDQETIDPYRGELLSLHLPAEGFLDHLIPEGSYAMVVDAVLSDKVQAGIIPACYIEDHTHDLKLRDLEVLSPKDQKQLACKTSTDLYLGPVFASAFDADPHVNRLIAQALLNTPSRDGFLWTTGGDLSGAHTLFKKLGQAQYGALSREFILKFFKDYAAIFSALFAALIVLILHWMRVNRLVDKRTQQLRALQAEADAVQDKLDRMQQVGVVGLMSSTLSHELKQPLGVIGNYLQGLELLLQSGRMTPQAGKEAIDQIKKQLVRASAIIQKVRDYAKGRDKSHQSLDFTSLIKESISNLRLTRKETIKITFDSPKNKVFIDGDKTEIQLAVYNLLRNAAEACEKEKDPKISAVLACREGKAILSITDNGPLIDPRQIKLMTESLWTSKPNGMGLGIPIVKQIAEAHRGNLIFDTLPSGTLRVQLIIPLSKRRHD